MSVLQLSRITHRKGYIENLPQLQGAELGWALDDRRLFIGNGDITEGAPIIGNTEILTEHSDVLDYAGTYTYTGEHVGYVVNDAQDRTIQSKLDEQVSVKDFGAMGNGANDDTTAINTALYELFGRASNPAVRRSLYFPAGRYLVSDTIKIPPYASIVGDGITSTVIEYESSGSVIPHIMETVDSDFHSGVNIGTGGATPPTGISITDLQLLSPEKNSLLLLDNITDSTFTRLSLNAGMAVTDLGAIGSGPSSAIKVRSSNSLLLESTNITFNQCITSGTTYGLDVMETSVKSIRFENGRLNNHFIGVAIGAATTLNATMTGVNITRSIFDNISAQGILIATGTMNSSAFNVFYSVGNGFATLPITPVIEFADGNNISIGDLFERDQQANLVHPRIMLHGQPSIAFDSTYAMKLGEYQRTVGLITELQDNSSGSVFEINSKECSSFQVDYTISRQKGGFNEVKKGALIVVNKYDPLNPSNPVSSAIEFNEEFTESGNVGITLSAIQNGFNVNVTYVSDNLGGTPAAFKYSVQRLD